MTGRVRVTPPDGPFHATVDVPGDKSLSHRALIFAGMAEGVSEVRNPGPGHDVGSTTEALRRLGVHVEGERVVSPGVTGWHAVARPIDCGNSGTTMRLLAGALAGRPHETTLDGDASLRRRPMERLVAPLHALGADVTVGDGGVPPITVAAPDGLHGADVVLPLASAQVRTAFALAAVQAAGPSQIASPPGFRDHTERWLAAMGRGRSVSSTVFTILPGDVPANSYPVPGDPSSAAFLWAAAALVPGAEVTTPGISLNPGRIGFLEILEAMGAEIAAEVTGEILDDPVGSVMVRGRELVGTEIAGRLAVEALDELPLVAVLGARAEGITTVRDAAELRGKESDRIATSVGMIRDLGGGAEAWEDGFAVVGTGLLDGGVVRSGGDHRIAMAAGVAAAIARGPITIVDGTVAGVSWPGFFDVLETTWSSP